MKVFWQNWLPVRFASVGQGEGLWRAEGRVKTGLNWYIVAQGVESGYAAPQSPTKEVDVFLRTVGELSMYFYQEDDFTWIV